MGGSGSRRVDDAFGRRLLVVTPDRELRGDMVACLGGAGYAVKPAESGAGALELLDDHRFDLAILDIEIADLDDLARCRPSLAARPLVVGMSPCESLDRVVPEVGTELEDYVTKPCRLAELLARVRVALRSEDGDNPLRHGDLVLDTDGCRAWRGDRPLDLTAAEFRLLRHLMGNAGRVLSKEQLAQHVWGETRDPNAIEQLVSRLRRKVGLITTRRGFGYSLGDVT